MVVSSKGSVAGGTSGLVSGAVGGTAFPIYDGRPSRFNLSTHYVFAELYNPCSLWTRGFLEALNDYVTGKKSF